MSTSTRRHKRGSTHATDGCLLYRSEKGRRIGLAQYRVRTPLKISSTFLGVGPRHLFRKTLTNTPPELLVQSPLQDVDGVPYKWTHGRIVLMGDAAHPMMPDMAQGASQTFVDAFAIREAFAKADNVDQALMDFETNRRDVANAVVKISQKGLFLGPNDVDPSQYVTRMRSNH